MYIRYIHKLYDLHLKAQNYTGMLKTKAVTYGRCIAVVCILYSGPVILTALLSISYILKDVESCFPSGKKYLYCLCVTEASYTLLLYDELLEWSDRPLREFLNYPMQSEWQRKEYLHLTIVQNFDRGKVNLNAHILFLHLSSPVFLQDFVDLPFAAPCRITNCSQTSKRKITMVI